MKKIFTLVFLAGLMTTGAMAQNGRDAQYRNQNNNNQPPAYANNGQFNQGGNGYSHNNDNGQNNGYYRDNHNNDNGYGHDQPFYERNDNRRFRDHDRFEHNPYAYERQRDFERYNRRRFFIRFRQPSCF